MSEEKLSPQEAVVKRYLDDQAQRDDALRSLYVPSKIKDCFEYVKEQAKKMAVDGCAMVEDSLVFKWARDYYLEELPKKASRDAVEIASKNAAEISGASAKSDSTKCSDDSHDSTENDDAVLAERKEVTVIKGSRYDDEGNGLLFDF